MTTTNSEKTKLTEDEARESLRLERGIWTYRDVWGNRRELGAADNVDEAVRVLRARGSVMKLNVCAPRLPGGPQVRVGSADTVADARDIASAYADRRDLHRCDVRIEFGDGRLLEYAGPVR